MSQPTLISTPAIKDGFIPRGRWLHATWCERAGDTDAGECLSIGCMGPIHEVGPLALWITETGVTVTTATAEVEMTGEHLLTAHQTYLRLVSEREGLA